MATKSVETFLTLKGIREAHETTVRYGRARLKVFRFGGLIESELTQEIERYEAGEVDAEELAWAFIHERVSEHTPSFSWEKANLALLLDRIVAVSTAPVFADSSVEVVAETLVEAALEEREAQERTRKRNERWAREVSGRFGLIDKVRPIVATMEKNFPGGSAAGLKAKGIIGLDPTMGKVAHYSIASALSKKVELRGVLGFDGSFTTLAAGSAAGASLHYRSPDFFKGFESRAGATQWFQGSDFLKNLGSSLVGTEFAGFGKRPGGLELWHKLGLADLSATAAFAKAMKAYDKPLWPGARDFGFAEISKKWVERLRESYPANWRDLTRGEIDAATQIMLEPGLAVAWVPRTEILRELLEAGDDEARVAVLEARSAEIVDDVEVVLGEVDLIGLAQTVDATRKAIAAHRDGHTDAALALAATALTNIVHNYMGEKTFHPIKETFGEVDPVNEVGIEDFALYMIGKIWIRVNRRFENNLDPGFNRNRTLHLLGSHYSETNLIAVLMLLAGLCRELQRFEARTSAKAPAAKSAELVAA